MRQSVDGNKLREIMRRVPSPVTVITAGEGGVLRGMTAGSFTSVSLLPPLISFNVTQGSRMHEVLDDASLFAVHILADDQAHLSIRFAEPDQDAPDQFQDVAFHVDERGLPILEDTIGVLFCTPYAVYEVGDHSLYVGEVIEARLGREALPLIYLDRIYRTVGETVASDAPLVSSASPGSSP